MFMNPMKEIKIEKVVLNIGCGTKLNPEVAKKLLERITEKKAVITKTKKRSTFGVAKNKPIGCKVTIRKHAEKILEKLLQAKETLTQSNFDETGNFSFGIKEYIDVPGIDYDPSIGILGFDVCVSLCRPGFRVARKKLKSKIGKNHKIKKDEAIEFVEKKFGIKVME